MRRFAEQVVAPASRQIDRQQRIPEPVMSGLAAMGVLGMALGVDDGGAGASSVDLGIAVEELATADFVVGQLPVMGGLVANAVAQASPVVRDSVLPALLEGRTLVAFALTEPEADRTPAPSVVPRRGPWMATASTARRPRSAT